MKRSGRKIAGTLITYHITIFPSVAEPPFAAFTFSIQQGLFSPWGPRRSFTDEETETPVLSKIKLVVSSKVSLVALDYLIPK